MSFRSWQRVLVQVVPSRRSLPCLRIAESGQRLTARPINWEWKVESTAEDATTAGWSSSWYHGGTGTAATKMRTCLPTTDCAADSSSGQTTDGARDST